MKTRLLLAIMALHLFGGCGQTTTPSPSYDAASIAERQRVQKIVADIEAKLAKKTKAQSNELSANPEWKKVAHWGLITTVWVNEPAASDKYLIAQILGHIRGTYGKGIVWFFDEEKYTPIGVPMTDNQMLHWIGIYDPTQCETFQYVNITDRTTSPPKFEWINTQIRPGFAE